MPLSVVSLFRALLQSLVHAMIVPLGPLDDLLGRATIHAQIPVPVVESEVRQGAERDPAGDAAWAGAAQAIGDDHRVGALVEPSQDVRVGQAGREHLLGSPQSQHEVVILVVRAPTAAVGPRSDLGANDRRQRPEVVEAKDGRQRPAARGVIERHVGHEGAL